MRTCRLRGSTIAALLFGAAACGGAEVEDGESSAGESGAEAAVAAAGTTCAELVAHDTSSLRTTESGLRTKDLVRGEGGTVTAGDSVVVHYLGCLPDGRKFDSSYDRGTPFGATRPLVVGSGQVIPGWDEGLLGMRPGGERLLVVPPELAYGDRGAGDVIPPGSTLVFKVEMLRRGAEEAPADTGAASSAVSPGASIRG